MIALFHAGIIVAIKRGIVPKPNATTKLYNVILKGTTNGVNNEDHPSMNSDKIGAPK